MANKYTLYGSKGTGSTIVEVLLALAEIKYDLVDIPYEKVLEKDPVLLDINPLSRVPVLKLPNGEILTESGAMAIHIAGISKTPLLPSIGDKMHGPFLRWLFIINAEIYPTFTFGDDPSDWVSGPIAIEELRRTTDKFRKELWQSFESSLPLKPWVLGDRVSVLDAYISVMTRWRPGLDWFRENCPKIYAVAMNMAQLKNCKDIFDRNFS